jgi:hypothetical protein
MGLIPLLSQPKRARPKRPSDFPPGLQSFYRPVLFPSIPKTISKRYLLDKCKKPRENKPNNFQESFADSSIGHLGGGVCCILHQIEDVKIFGRLAVIEAVFPSPRAFAPISNGLCFFLLILA